MLKNEPILKYADYQTNWAKYITPTKKSHVLVEDVSQLSIAGDAPKSFVKIREYGGKNSTKHPKRWPAHIAKVGSKFYPIESITEQLMTRIGQIANLKIARSELRMLGNQVRFLSRYFLKKNEQLVHGIEIFRHHLDEDFVAEIADQKREAEFYTFQMIGEAIEEKFPDEFVEIMRDFVEMLAFDALVGNNDRHPANWGVVVHISRGIKSRFSPIFDTARGLFWNHDEARIEKTLENPAMFNKYIVGSQPLVGWGGGQTELNHLELMGSIHADYPDYRSSIEKLLAPNILDECTRILEVEFSNLMSKNRRKLILRCLCGRSELLAKFIGL